MSKSFTFENKLLKLLFNGEAIPGIADNAAASPVTSLYLSLHTADPDANNGGNQTTSEVNYTGYARVPVVRTAAGWKVTGNSVSPVMPIDFNEVTAGTGVIAYAAIGTALSGPGSILYRGAIDPVVDFKPGVIPRIRNTSTITEN